MLILKNVIKVIKSQFLHELYFGTIKTLKILDLRRIHGSEYGSVDDTENE